MAKTEHVTTCETAEQIQLNGEALKNVDHFKYLGSIINTYRTIDKDVDLRVQAAWSS